MLPKLRLLFTILSTVGTLLKGLVLSKHISSDWLIKSKLSFQDFALKCLTDVILTLFDGAKTVVETAEQLPWSDYSKSCNGWNQSILPTNSLFFPQKSWYLFQEFISLNYIPLHQRYVSVPIWWTKTVQKIIFYPWEVLEQLFSQKW